MNDILTNSAVVDFSGKATLPNDIAEFVIEKHKNEYDLCMDISQKSKYLYNI